MSQSSRDGILGDIRKTLGRNPGSAVGARPAIVPPRTPGARDAEIDKLVREINAVKGEARNISPADVRAALGELVALEKIRAAVCWKTPTLARLQVVETLATLGVEIIPTSADRAEMARADLGITEADFALPETGTLGLLSSTEKPRMVSLLPRVHLAIVSPGALRADLHQVFAEAESENYLILITGPSRTSDIELVVTIGVHGPQRLYAWILTG